MENELRRLKIKLALLDIEGVSWLLGDMVDLVEEDVSDYQGRPYTDKGKIFLIEKLKSDYKKELKELEPEDKKQQKLFQ